MPDSCNKIVAVVQILGPFSQIHPPQLCFRYIWFVNGYLWLILTMCQWAFVDKCIAISLCCSSTCCCSSFHCMKYGITSPSSNNLTVGNTYLVAHLKLLLEGHPILGFSDCGFWFRAEGNQICVQVHNNELPSKPQTHPVAGIRSDRLLYINLNLQALFSIPWTCMFNTCGVYHNHIVIDLVLYTCADVFQVWSLKLEQEVEKNKALTEALHILATEHHDLKQSFHKNRRSSTLSTLTEDDFYDALSGQSPWIPNISRCV